MTDPTEIARVAAGLTRAQREAVLAIGNGEARRAVHFSGAVARRLCQVTGKRPALLSSRLVNSGRVALFETTAAGMAVRDHILREKSGG